MGSIWQRLVELERDAIPYALVTVVRTLRPMSAQVGMKAVVLADGTLEGFVGGHCTRRLVSEAGRSAIRSGQSELLIISPEPVADADPGVRHQAMTCESGGTVELFIEPRLPTPVLAVVGDTPVAHALAEMAPVMDLRVCRLTWDPPESLDAFQGRIQNAIRPGDFLVVASQGDYDAEALLAVAAQSLRYVGLVASPRRAAAVRDALRRQGVESTFLERLSAPAGLDLGARTPAEIAVSILAELVRVGISPVPADVKLAATASMVVDPICGMTVDLSKTPHQAEYGGRRFGFCCGACRERFIESPERYVEATGRHSA
jgi:xanthine dehydrogenase accessory factor